MAETEKPASLKGFRVCGVEYDFDPARIRNDEGMAIERALGCSFGDWTDALAQRSMSALTALVWLLQRRENPTLKFSEVRFEVGDVEPIEADDSEVQTTDPTSAPEVSTPGA